MIIDTYCSATTRNIYTIQTKWILIISICPDLSFSAIFCNKCSCTIIDRSNLNCCFYTSSRCILCRHCPLESICDSIHIPISVIWCSMLSLVTYAIIVTIGILIIWCAIIIYIAGSFAIIWNAIIVCIRLICYYTVITTITTSWCDRTIWTRSSTNSSCWTIAICWTKCLHAIDTTWTKISGNT